MTPSRTVSVAGRGVHKPSERGVRVHAGPGPGGRRHRLRARPAGGRADLPVPVLLVHGQRDLVPAEAVPGGGLEGEVLGPMSGHSEPTLLEHAADKRGARLLYRDLHRVESVRHQQQHGHDGLSNGAGRSVQHRHHNGGLTQRSNRS